MTEANLMAMAEALAQLGQTLPEIITTDHLKSSPGLAAVLLEVERLSGLIGRDESDWLKSR